MQYFIFEKGAVTGPYEFSQLIDLYRAEAITGATQVREAPETSEWRQLSVAFPIIGNMPTLSKILAVAVGEKPAVETIQTKIVDIDMPLFAMVRFLIGWAFAAIPAGIILALIYGLLAGVFQALMRHA